ncbi:MAG: NADP-dependent oxidoreductase [Paracoccaceae bacterium]
MPQTARTIQLVQRPVGAPRPEDFRIAEVPLPDPGPGEVLLKMEWLSLDPYMRGRMSDARSYAAPTPLGDPPPTEAVARVLRSRDPSLAEGDQVLVYDAWRDCTVVKAATCRKLDPAQAPVQAWLGILGMPGLTAWAGLKHIGQPKRGETLVVGAATGAVGSVVGQIARLQGLRVVGVAGGPEKCRHATETLGFDACLDRHQPDLAQRMAEVCPKGIEIYFELTGGDVLAAVLPLLNPFARIPVCGTIASYNATTAPEGPDRLPSLMRLILTRSLTVRGFIVSEFAADRPAFEAEMSGWLANGSIHHREDVSKGLDSMVPAFIGMLEGRNFGKTLVHLA